MQIEIWAPPTISIYNIQTKLNEWMQLHPSKPPFERFLQDHISSEWPVFWHLKTMFIFQIDYNERVASPVEDVENVLIENCSICYNTLESGSEILTCRHEFHTMCLHKWLRYNSTCPLCRAEIE
jgi:hypothetical protein